MEDPVVAPKSCHLFNKGIVQCTDTFKDSPSIVSSSSHAPITIITISPRPAAPRSSFYFYVSYFSTSSSIFPEYPILHLQIANFAQLLYLTSVQRSLIVITHNIQLKFEHICCAYKYQKTCRKIMEQCRLLLRVNAPQSTAMVTITIQVLIIRSTIMNYIAI